MRLGLDRAAMTYALAQLGASAIDRAAVWVHLNPEERKRRAVRAARDRDEAELWSLCEAYLVEFSAARAAVSRHTLRAYRTGLRQWLEAMSDQSLLAVDANRANHWIGSVQVERRGPKNAVPNPKRPKAEPQRLKSSSLAVKLAAVRTLYSALRWAGCDTKDPLEFVKPPRGKRYAEVRVNHYGDDEVERLLASTNDPRLHLLVLLGAHAGLRIAESCALESGDVDLHAHRLTVRQGKGDKERTVRLSKRLVVLLADYRGHKRTLLGFGTNWARTQLKKLCLLAGVPYRATHALRHSSGTRLYRATKDLKKVARHLGHASVQTAQMYAHVDDDEIGREVDGW